MKVKEGVGLATKNLKEVRPSFAKMAENSSRM
jgi:hypothetical protein